MTVEAMLSEIAVAWPETPDLAAPVAARIQVAPSRAPRKRSRGWPLPVAIATLLLMAATAAAIPGIRNPVLDWLGLRSVRIERIERPLPRGAGAGLGLGRHVSLADARARLGFVPLVPRGLGTPAVYHDSFPPGGRIGLVYRRGELFLVEFSGTTTSAFLRKFVTPQTKLDRLRIDSAPALWIHGGLDQYMYADRTGAVHADQIRTAGKVLLWRRGDLVLRLEGARSRAEALRIARSLRAAP